MYGNRILHLWLGGVLGFVCSVQILTAANFQNLVWQVTVQNPPAPGASINFPQLTIARTPPNGSILSANFDPRTNNGVSRIPSTRFGVTDFQDGWRYFVRVQTIANGNGPNCSPSTFCEWSPDVQVPTANGQTIYHVINWAQLVNDPDKCFTVNLANATDFARDYRVGNTSGTDGVLVRVPPHTTMPVSWCPENGDAQTVSIDEYNPATGQYDKPIGTFGSGSSGWGDSPTGGTPQGATGGTGISTNVTPGDGINFGDGSDLAREATLRAFANQMNSVLNQGFAREYDLGTYLNSQASQINSGIAPLGGKLDAISGSVAAQGGKLDTIAANTLTTANAVSAGNMKLDTIANNVAAGNTSLGTINSSLSGVNGINSRIQDTTAAVHNSRVVLNQTLTAIDTRLGNNHTLEYAKMVGLFDETAATRALLASDLPQITAALQSGEVVDTQGLGKLDTIAANTATTAGNVSSGNAKLDAANSLLAQVRDAIAAQQQIDARPNIDAVKSSVDAVKASIDGLQFPTSVDPRPNIDAFHETFRNFTNAAGGVPGLDALRTEVNQLLANEQVSTKFDGIVDSISVPAEAAPSHFPDVWTVSVGGYTFNMNPLGWPGIAELANAVRQTVNWIVVVIYVLAVYRMFDEKWQALSQAPQLAGPNIQVLGNSFGKLAIPLWFGAMLVAFGLLPAMIVVWWTNSGYAATLGLSPVAYFVGVGGGVAAGVGLANAFLPLDAIVIHVVLYFLVRVSSTAVFTVSFLAIRALFH